MRIDFLIPFLSPFILFIDRIKINFQIPVNRFRNEIPVLNGSLYILDILRFQSDTGIF